MFSMRTRKKSKTPPNSSKPPKKSKPPKTPKNPKPKAPVRKRPPPQDPVLMAKEMKEMTDYILKDAWEKAEEIDIKTDEDAKIVGNKHRNKIVRKIEDDYKKKEKKVLNDVETQNSLDNNSMRMVEIKAKQKHIDDLRKDVEEQLRVDCCSGNYSNTLRLLLLEGCYKLMDTPIKVRCKQKDVTLIRPLLPEVAADYKESTKQDMELKMDCCVYLDPKSIGGVKMSINNERVTLDNTLDSKLDQIMHSCIPAIGIGLFGKNPNRNYF